MRKLLMMAAVTCGFGMAVSATAQATTIDTFNFTQTGWNYILHTSGGVGEPDPGGILTGTFTGTVEPSGLIELGDLSSFSVLHTDSAGVALGESLPSLTLFSYDINGGASSLGVAGPEIPYVGAGHTICVGAAAALSPICAGAPSFSILSFPLGTNGRCLSSHCFPRGGPSMGVQSPRNNRS